MRWGRGLHIILTWHGRKIRHEVRLAAGQRFVVRPKGTVASAAQQFENEPPSCGARHFNLTGTPFIGSMAGIPLGFLTGCAEGIILPDGFGHGHGFANPFPRVREAGADIAFFFSAGRSN